MASSQWSRVGCQQLFTSNLITRDDLRPGHPCILCPPELGALAGNRSVASTWCNDHAKSEDTADGITSREADVTAWANPTNAPRALAGTALLRNTQLVDSAIWYGTFRAMNTTLSDTATLLWEPTTCADGQQTVNCWQGRGFAQDVFIGVHPNTLSTTDTHTHTHTHTSGTAIIKQEHKPKQPLKRN